MNKIIEQEIKTILSEKLPWKKLKGKTIAISGSRGHIASWLLGTLVEVGMKYNLELKCHCLHKPFCDITKVADLSHVYTDKIDYIFHAASYATPTYFKNDPVGTILPNTIGTYNLLELAKAKKAEFIYFSTSGVYGWHDTEDYPLTETEFGSLDCAKVENCYLESKRLGEQLCMSYNYQHGITTKLLRLGICYGPGMKLDDGRVMGTFIKKVLDKNNITIYNEYVYRSFMYITDVISAIFHILFCGDTGPYNIAADYEVSILELAELFSGLYPDSDVKHQSRGDRLSVDFSRTWMDCTRLKCLGWEQKMSLENGIKRTVESYR